MKNISFQIDDESHQIIKAKAKQAGLTLKDYLIACGKAAKVEIVITFDKCCGDNNGEV